MFGKNWMNCSLYDLDILAESTKNIGAHSFIFKEKHHKAQI